MTEIVPVQSLDRAHGTQIGIACELRGKPCGAVPGLTMDGGPRIGLGQGTCRAGLGREPPPPAASTRFAPQRCDSSLPWQGADLLPPASGRAWQHCGARGRLALAVPGLAGRAGACHGGPAPARNRSGARPPTAGPG
jgi:hypothetical protein